MRIVTLFALALALSIASACGDDGRASDASADSAMPDATTDAAPGDAGCILASARCDRGDTCCGDLVCREASSGDGFCVEMADTCFVAAQDGCCLDDADCEGDATCYGFECRTMGDGICKSPPAAGECWADRDCPAGMSCSGANICPCGTSCIAPDTPGTCG